MDEPNPKDVWAFQRRVLAAAVDAARNTYERAQRADERRVALACQTIALIRIERLTRP